MPGNGWGLTGRQANVFFDLVCSVIIPLPLRRCTCRTHPRVSFSRASKLSCLSPFLSRLTLLYLPRFSSPPAPIRFLVVSRSLPQVFNSLLFRRTPMHAMSRLHVNIRKGSCVQQARAQQKCMLVLPGGVLDTLSLSVIMRIK